ncbi:hypothetical protein [Citreimonas salinaria]|uniref:Uncharacterized protein n=1 Tax=Citreimonas salinaria TaxID=321339 RepID=A0A1H3LZ49_9RHOB|nr:hypothetical protein [Citreimonas salinaria]SDY69606.1 hypothetical protein SAMN05444340_1158 [Citreimonas salinaria]
MAQLTKEERIREQRRAMIAIAEFLKRTGMTDAEAGRRTSHPRDAVSPRFFALCRQAYKLDIKMPNDRARRVAARLGIQDYIQPIPAEQLLQRPRRERGMDL